MNSLILKVRLSHESKDWDEMVDRIEDYIKLKKEEVCKHYLE